MNKKILRYQYEHHKQSNKTFLLFTIFLSLALSSKSLGLPPEVLSKTFGALLLVYLINLIIHDYHSDKYYSSIVDYSSTSDEPHLETWKKIREELENKKSFYQLRILAKYSYFGFGGCNALQMLGGYLFLFILVILFFLF